MVLKCKRHEKAILITCKKTRHIDNKLFYLAWYRSRPNDHCFQLDSKSKISWKKKQPKVGFKPKTTQIIKQNNFGNAVSRQSSESNPNPSPNLKSLISDVFSRDFSMSVGPTLLSFMLLIQKVYSLYCV